VQSHPQIRDHFLWDNREAEAFVFPFRVGHVIDGNVTAGQHLERLGFSLVNMWRA
jgi:hypothetical protein